MDSVESFFRAELDGLRRRLAQLEARMDRLEPETLPGVGGDGERPYAAAEVVESDSPILDVVGDALSELGLFARDE